MNSNKLKGKLREKGHTYKDLSMVIGTSVTTASRKINGHVEFDCAEASMVSIWLGLSNDESVDIFFAPKLA